MAARRAKPAPRTATAFCAITELQTRVTIDTATRGIKGATLATAAGVC